jgi:hypothetical protein
MISSPNERMEPENRRNFTMENLTRRNARGHRSGVIEPTQNCLFYIEGLKRTDKGNHHEGRTQKVCNPSIIAPTTPQSYIAIEVDDYG